MKNLYTLACLLFISFNLAAQFAIKTFDIHSKPSDRTYPRSYTLYNNKVYFIAADSAHGAELWVCDGNSVSLVADIMHGTKGSFPTDGTHPELCVVSGKLYFRATDSNYKTGIYAYDGTNPPSLITNVDSGILDPVNLVEANGNLYYAADTLTTPFYTKALLEYNPVTNKHKVIHKFIPKPSPGSYYIVSFNNNLYFHDKTPQNDSGLIMFDPTNYSYTILTDIYGNDVGMSREKFLNNKLYFEGDIQSTGRQIYEYDGLTTIKSLSYDALTNTSYTKSFLPWKAYTVVDNKLYFTGTTTGNSGIISYSFNNQQYNFETNYNSYQTFISNGKNIFIGAGNRTMVYNTKIQQQSYIDSNRKFAIWYKSDHVIHNGWLYCTVEGDSITSRIGLLYDSSVSVKEIPVNHLPATLYPNPTTGDAQLEFTLDDAQVLSVQITDITGKIVFRNKSTQYNAGKQKILLSTASLHVGTYIITILDERLKTVSSGKLLKE